MNILEGLKIKKSSLETHVGTISIKFVFKTLALDEIIKEMHMYQEEERISKEPRKENSQAALCQGKNNWTTLYLACTRWHLESGRNMPTPTRWKTIWFQAVTARHRLLTMPLIGEGLGFWFMILLSPISYHHPGWLQCFTWKTPSAYRSLNLASSSLVKLSLLLKAPHVLTNSRTWSSPRHPAWSRFSDPPFSNTPFDPSSALTQLLPI